MYDELNKINKKNFKAIQCMSRNLRRPPHKNVKSMYVHNFLNNPSRRFISASTSRFLDIRKSKILKSNT